VKRAQTHTYSIHDIIRIRSTRRLPELEYFRTKRPLEQVDIDVRVDAALKSGGADDIGYRELAGLGFGVDIDRRKDCTQVVVSPLVGSSPHVLYTNVVEPLLRWRFVRKGYALMHGACLEFGGEALFITAQTDTGKTTTILNMVRRHPELWGFLADDMTIVSADGLVRSYPKPLTISQHTLRAMGGSPLTWKEYLLLRFQSRLHSRGGRRTGLWLSRSGAPAATLNALVQRLIPPPKFMVDRLVPKSRYAEQARLTRIALIERGPDLQEDMGGEELVETLLVNAEDAYTFPPYPALAGSLSRWNGQDLHKLERLIITSAVRGVPGFRLRSNRFAWDRQLLQLLGVEDKVGASGAGAWAPGKLPGGVVAVGKGGAV